MAWLRLPSITATQGSITVTVNNDFETEHIQVGDGLLVGQFALVEIVGIHSQQLTLKDAWPNATQTNVAGAIVPTASDFQLAANLLREATTVTHGNFAAMEQWWTENTDVTFTGYDGSKYSVPSAQKMQDNALVKGMSPYEHQYNKVRNALREIYDASGFVNWGNGYQGANVAHIKDINHGMWTDTSQPNNVRIGVTKGAVGATGSSKTAYSVVNVAGHEIHLRGVNHTSEDSYKLRFQDAEDGTTVTDSTGDCRGSGKAVLNLKTDIDPKYGNAPIGTAAEIQREAVGRAFEGQKKDGDFRSGSNAEWALGANKVITKGNCNLPNGVQSDVGHSMTWVNGVTYEIEFIIANKVGAGSIIGRVYSNINSVTLENGSNKFRFTAPSSSGQNPRVQVYTGSDAGCDVKGIFVRPITEDVLTRAVDLKYLEVFPEEDELEFFPYGSVQSGLTTVDGFTTEASSRPDTYRAVFPGDTASSKQCLKIAKLSFVDIAKLMSNPKHNWRYSENGKPLQTRYRDKAVRGAGNGDWVKWDDRAVSTVDPSGNHGLGFDNRFYPHVQGSSDTVEPMDNHAQEIFLSTNSTWNTAGKSEKGLFTAMRGDGVDTSRAYKGECYALVLCTVPRLNMGGYAPINAFGTRMFIKSDDSTVVKWNGDTKPINSLADCFDLGDYHQGAKVHARTGEISTGLSGHPDGLLHDAIYASGFNGVIDHRQPAKSPQDNWKESLQGYYAAKVRGVQKLPFVAPVAERYPSSNSRTHYIFSREYYDGDALGNTTLHVGGLFHKVRGGVLYSSVITSLGSEASGNQLRIDTVDEMPRTADTYSLLEVKLDTSVSGAFSCNTVVADPANWVQTPQVAQGIIGVWSPEIPENSNGQKIPAVRKALVPQIERVWSTDLGASWSVGAGTVDSALNTMIIDSFTGVLLMQYKAYAYQVEDGENDNPVDVAPVNTFNFHRKDWGALFHESALHKVNVNSDTSSSLLSELVLLDFTKYPDVAIDANSNRQPKHAPISLSAPTNNSPACKALPFLVEKNGYLYIAWHVNELGWRTGNDGAVSGGEVTGNVPKFNLFYLNGQSNSGWFLSGHGSGGRTFDDYQSDGSHFLDINGNLRDATTVYYYRQPLSTGSWGDDSKIKVTSSQAWDTFVDLNGNTMTRRVVISTFPIGPAKKKTLVGGLSSPA